MVPTTGQVTGTVSVPTTTAMGTTMSNQPTVQQANIMDAPRQQSKLILH